MLSQVSYIIVDSADATYAFTFDWLRVAHIEVYLNGVAVPASDFAITGTSGAGVVTLSGTTLTNLELNDVLLIKKVTPVAFDDRTVNFTNDGGVSLASLDDAFKHDLSVAQDLTDEVSLCLKKDTDNDDHFDADNQQIRHLTAGTTSDSAVNLAQLQAVSTASGALPPVDTAFNDHFLGVFEGNWASRTPDEAKAALNLGTASDADTGVAAAGDLPTRADADARYLRVANDLSDVTAATARTNLGLGGAAVLEGGTGANQLLQLDSGGDIPAGVGVDPGIDLSGTSVYHKGGGLRDAINIVELTELGAVPVDNDGVTISDDFETDPLNNLQLDAGPAYAFRNTSPVETGVNTTSDIVNLTAGTWLLDLEVSFYDDLAGARRMGLALYDVSAGAVIEKLNNSFTLVIGLEDSVASITTYRLRAIYTFAGGARAIAVRAATATGSTAFVVKGQLLCHRIA